MTKSKLIFLIFLFFVTANAQWIVQQVPTTNRLYDVYFADSSEGWVTGYDGIFHSIDGGNSWERQCQMISVHITGLNKSELWATGNRDTLLHTTNGGIYWDKISITEFTDLDSIPDVEAIYFFDNNFGWTQVRGWKDGSFVARLLKTTDGGISWEMRTHPWLSADAYIQFFDSLYGYRTGSSIPFFRTTDGGETWDLVTWYGYMFTFSMQFLTKEIGWMSIDGPVLTTSAINTTNGGEDWLFNIMFQCSDLSTYLNFADTLNGWAVQWTCLYGGRTEIWHTSDGSSSWDLQFTFSPPFYFRPNKIFFVDSLRGWVVGEHGVILHTSNGGIIPVELISFTAEVIQDGVMLNWTTATETNNQGFEVQRSEVKSQNSEWEAIGFVAGNGNTTETKSYSFIDKDVYFDHYNYRLKQIDFDGTFNYSEVIEVKVDFTPKKFILEQNYPNPFNSSTIIKYSLPEATSVSITVYDILGTEVKVLVNEKKEPGNYEINFDAVDLPSGVYIYTLTSGGFVDTKKLILLK